MVIRIRNMEEFSTATGLSRPTVSKYFNDPDSVRPTTRTRIEAAMAKFDYRPNFLAINQNRKNPKTIGIIVPLLVDAFYAELVRQIEAKCITAGYWPIVLSSHGSHDQEARAVEMMRALNIGAVILAPLGEGSDLAQIEKLVSETPVVLLDSHIDDIPTFIGTDNGQSIGIMVDYLCASGTPPCYLDLPNVNSNARERREAYRAAMERQGHTPQIIATEDEGWAFEDQGYAAASRFLSTDGFPSTTVLCANDRLAIGVLSAAYTLNVTVGRDGALRVAGHDDHPLSRFTCPGLTTVAQDFDGLSSSAVTAVLNLIDRNTRINTEIRLPARLIPRASA